MTLDSAFAHVRSGDLEAALRACQAELAAGGDIAAAWQLLGTLHHQCGRFAQALVAYGEARRLKPANPALLRDQASTLRVLGHHQEALQNLEQAWQLHPGDPATLSLLLACRISLGRSDAEAIALEEIAAVQAQEADQAQLPFLQGMVRRQLGQNAEAVEQFTAALNRDPAHREARLQRARLHQSLGHPSQAEQDLRQLLEADAEDLEALQALADLQRCFGRIDDALSTLERISALAPNLSATASQRLQILQSDPQRSNAELLQAAQEWGQASEQRATACFGGPVPRQFRPHDANAPLRLGYLIDSVEPAGVHRSLGDLLQAHDPARVQPFVYCLSRCSDAWMRQLLQAAHASGADLVEVSGLSDRALRERIRLDRIDVLLNLCGHGANTPLSALALRPAPVQISWLACGASTGLPAMDYLILDPWQLPPQSEPSSGEQWFSEQLLQLPHAAFCFRPPPAADPSPPPLRRNGLIQFGSVHTTGQRNGGLLDAWAAILSRVPDSRLLLLDPTFDPSGGDAAERSRLLEQFCRRGISADRLILGAPSQDPERLHDYDEIDIALDPYPLSADLSSVQALWMGVPVLTLPQRQPASRRTLSILAGLGLETELAASDAADYIERAVRLAGDPAKLDHWRASLRQRLADSPLCDIAQFTRDLEDLVQNAYQFTHDLEQFFLAAANPVESAPGQSIPLQSDSPRYVVVAPPYSDKSAGIWILHFLTHTLNQLGYCASLYLDEPCAQHINPAFETPFLEEITPQIQENAYIIYPEVVSGNPLGGKNIIRYMLNHEGFIGGNTVDAGPDDFFVTFHPSFHPEPHFTLFYPITNPNLFNDDNAAPACERTLDLFYVGKGSTYGDCPPIREALELTRDWPSRKEELALLLRNTRYFFSYDNLSSTNVDAILCGAIPILLIDQPVSREAIYNDPSQPPFLTGFGAEAYATYFERVDLFRRNLQAQAADFPRKVVALDHWARTHFEQLQQRNALGQSS